MTSYPHTSPADRDRIEDRQLAEADNRTEYVSDGDQLADAVLGLPHIKAAGASCCAKTTRPSATPWPGGSMMHRHRWSAPSQERR